MIMERRSAGIPNLVVELKRSRSDDPEDWRREAEEGLRQIKDREYYHGLEGRTLLYGICFRNKRARASMEEISLRGHRRHDVARELGRSSGTLSVHGLRRSSRSSASGRLSR